MCQAWQREGLAGTGKESKGRHSPSGDGSGRDCREIEGWHQLRGTDKVGNKEEETSRDIEWK